jgi:hypothetical protein
LRYIQHPITLKLVPADEYYRPKEASHAVFGDIESFVSPVDGAVITDRKQLREHNERNGVVSYSEYSPEFIEKQKKKREDFFDGKTSREDTLNRKQKIYELMTQAER